MTNREIKYELAECLVTTGFINELMYHKNDVTAVNTMKDRLILLYNYFDDLYQKEQELIDKKLDNILKNKT